MVSETSGEKTICLKVLNLLIELILVSPSGDKEEKMVEAKIKEHLEQCDSCRVFLMRFKDKIGAVCPIKKEKKTFTLEEFKLACIVDEELTDEQVEVLMKMVVLESEEDVVEFFGILHKYRPELEKKFAAGLGRGKET